MHDLLVVYGKKLKKSIQQNFVLDGTNNTFIKKKTLQNKKKNNKLYGLSINKAKSKGKEC